MKCLQWVYKTFPLATWVVFGLVYSGVYWFFVKPTVVSHIPLEKYGAFLKWLLANQTLLVGSGFIIGCIVFIFSRILTYIVRMFFPKLGNVFSVVCTILCYGLIAGLGYWLVYYEPRYTQEAVGIILFFGQPLWISAGIVVGMSVGMFLLLLFFSKKTQTLITGSVVVFSLLLVGGCESLLSKLGGLSCLRSNDPDHCYQRAAIQSGNPTDCLKIEGKAFKDLGSNPPRDKCYMLIARNKGDWTICKHIKGGEMSYTQDECIQGVSEKIFQDALEADSAVACSKLASLPKGYQSKYHECRKRFSSLQKMQEVDAKIEEILRGGSGDEDVQKELSLLEQERQARYEYMSDADKASYFRAMREKKFAEIEDEELKHAIAAEYNRWKSSHNPKNINVMLDKLDAIIAKQKLVKEVDTQANELLDILKQQIVDIVEEKKSEMLDSIIEKGEQAIRDREKKRKKDKLYVATKIRRAKEKYDLAHKEYNDLMERYENYKEVYQKIVDTYQKMDEIDALVKKGKIDKARARVLKGSLLLSNGLSCVSSYIPVFGSTASNITSATFATVLEVAKKRAQRSVMLEKCFEDPENCDVDGISAY